MCPCPVSLQFSFAISTVAIILKHQWHNELERCRKKAVHLFNLKMLCYVPITNETSLGKFKALDRATNGADIPETIKGPIKVRGTTPGNSKWSYCQMLKDV